ncbi:MAG: TraR/DksA family transcriptional regulator [Flavobacteriales bacterium]|nr:TraR/DksA family transcriptional regulator [Flavobacteriales bacterium]
MTDERKEEIRKLILSNMAQVEEKIKDLKELTKPIAPENAIGRISRMDAINNKSVNEAALRKTEEKKFNMERALERLTTEDDFGICKKCGEEIIAGRIMLMPESPFCTSCASR